MEKPSIERRIDDNVFHRNGEKHLLDRLDKAKVPVSVKVITSPDWMQSWANNGYQVTVPSILFNRGCRHIFSVFDDFTEESIDQGTLTKIIKSHQIDGTFLHSDDFQYHIDARIYPGLTTPISGEMKARFDRAVEDEIRSKGESALKNDYKFGIYAQ